MSEYLKKMGQGPWVKIEPDSIDEMHDDYGITHPDLHRRTLTEAEGISYKVSIHGVDSYRLTEYATHDEESRTSEIP